MSFASRLSKGRALLHQYRPSAWRGRPWTWRILLILCPLLLVMFVLMLWWSREPGPFDVQAAAVEYIPENRKTVVGSACVGTSVKILDVLLHKPGGYLRNDLFPPGLFLDNIPSWEYGVLTLMRETSQVLRNDFSRSQSQSAQAVMLERADNLLRNDSHAWLFPRPEAKYEQARQGLIRYGDELTDNDPDNAQFYARADNLDAYLNLVAKSMGDITQRLSASVGDVAIDRETGKEGDAQAKPAPTVRFDKTSWWEIDNHFFYARGYSWALLHQLRAIRIDFKGTLEKKGAMASLHQIINELEKTQKSIWSPLILNGRGFGFTANHSLVMASYISRANAALIDLQNLLRNG